MEQIEAAASAAAEQSKDIQEDDDEDEDDEEDIYADALLAKLQTSGMPQMKTKVKKSGIPVATKPPVFSSKKSLFQAESKGRKVSTSEESEDDEAVLDKYVKIAWAEKQTPKKRNLGQRVEGEGAPSTSASTKPQSSTTTTVTQRHKHGNGIVCCSSSSNSTSPVSKARSGHVAKYQGKNTAFVKPSPR